MSKVNFKKTFVSPLLRQLDNNAVRSKVEGHLGQVLILPNINGILATIKNQKDLSIPNEDQVRLAWEAGKAKAESLHKSYTRTKAGKRRLSILVNRWDELRFKIKNLILYNGTNSATANTYLLTGFRSHKLVKDEIFRKFEDLGLDYSSIAAKVHRGHGEAGDAVSQVEAASAFAKTVSMKGVSTDEFIDEFESYIKSINVDQDTSQKYIDVLTELKFTYSNVVTRTGRLKGSYFSYVSFQSDKENLEDKNFEQAFVKLLRNFIESKGAEDLFKQENSFSLEDKLKGFYQSTFVESVKGKVRKKFKQGLPKPGKVDSGKLEKKNKSKKPKISATVVGKTAKKSVRGTKVKESAISLATLKAQINTKLVATVRKNMVAPALRNRTGRFASSVQVTDVVRTAQGYPSVGYSYMLYPYQTFEPGFAQGSIDRDPRRLIDRSIREVASELLKGRFYTRRL